MECELSDEDDERPRRKKKKQRSVPSTPPQGNFNAEYFDSLRECAHQSIDQFDKVVLTLTAGGFGVSFAFLKDIIKPEAVTHLWQLRTAWGCWILGLCATLFAFW